MERSLAPTPPVTLSRRERLGILGHQSFKKRAQGWAVGWGIGAFLAVFVSSFAMVPTPQSDAGGQQMLQAAWKGVRSQMALDGQRGYPDAAQVARDVRVTFPTATVSSGYDYLDLRDHHRTPGTIDVKSVSPRQLVLVARKERGAIVEMTATNTDGPKFHILYHGKVAPYVWPWLRFNLEIALPALLALCLLGLALDERPRYRKRLTAQIASLVKDRELRARWQELVPDRRFGPEEPEVDFALFQPLKADREEVCRLSAQEVRWDGTRWRPTAAAYRVPKELATREVPIADQAVVPASEQWVELCQAVANENARRYAALCAAEEAAEKARVDALQRILDQLPDPDAAPPRPVVAAFLPPAGELLKTLPVE